VSFKRVYPKAARLRMCSRLRGELLPVAGETDHQGGTGHHATTSSRHCSESFFGGRLKAMAPKLLSRRSSHRHPPLAYVAERDIELTRAAASSPSFHAIVWLSGNCQRVAIKKTAGRLGT